VPTPTDDRAEFDHQKRVSAADMAADPDLAVAARDLFAASDRYGYSYMWSWLGVPIIQIPTDVMVLQELIWAERPQVIIETGVARGGSVIFFASMLQLIGEGRVIAIDIDIRPHNRSSIEEHPVAGRVTLIEGSSVAPDVVERVAGLVDGADRVMVVLDSDHSHSHVAAELNAYAPLVSPGQYLVVADTIVDDIPEQSHRPRPWGPGNNPRSAMDAFLETHPEFAPDPFTNAKLLLTSSPGGYLRRLRDPARP
jgi:cephalosporin hydroxylase